jgi:type II secretory pathway pseudopilin PulG
VTRRGVQLRSERGMTIIELMVAISLSMVVLLSTMSVLDRALHHSKDIQKRSASVQRGRLAMDDMVRKLRSQVCPVFDSTSYSVTAAAPTSVTFYSDFGDASGVPMRHTLSLNTTTAVLTDSMFTGTAGSPPTYPVSPTRVRVIGSGIVQSGTTPLFQYYAFDTATPPQASRLMTAPVIAADLPKIARIVITLQANPDGRVSGTKLTTTLQDEVFVRLADPNDAAPLPRCI